MIGEFFHILCMLCEEEETFLIRSVSTTTIILPTATGDLALLTAHG